MSLETRKGRLLDECDDFSGHDLPNATASEAVTGRAITSFWWRVVGRVFVSHEVRGAGRLCVAPEGESNQ